MSTNIQRWLSSIGLLKYLDAFRLLTDNAFCNLLHSQLPHYGVTDPEDKSKLHSLIHQLKSEGQKGGPSQQQLDLGHHLDGNAGLLDLDANDGDLLAHGAFQMSPLGNGKGRAPSRTPPTAPGGPSGTEEVADPPKITVVVRKRPMNRKEIEKGEDDIVEANSTRSFVTVNETKLKVDLTK